MTHYRIVKDNTTYHYTQQPHSRPFFDRENFDHFDNAYSWDFIDIMYSK